MLSTALIPFLDPAHLIDGFGAWALLGICFIVFAETGLLTFPLTAAQLADGGTQVIDLPIWLVCLAIAFAAFLGGEAGYLIGHKLGPRVFERKESGLFSVANVRRTNAFFERFGGLAIIVARFVPIVRTFAPVAAGVGHMGYKRYSLYNAIGALIWGAGLTFAGYLLGYIPPVADFVTHYIDIILLAAVCVSVIPTAFHYFQSVRKARRNREAQANASASTDTDSLVLDKNLFDQDKSNDPK